MSNIGFIQGLAKNIEKINHKYMHSTKVPSKSEKEEYKRIMNIINIMKEKNEIEDIELFNVLMKKLKECDLTTVVERRNKVL